MTTRVTNPRPHLSPADLESLALMAEEAAELGAIIGKALRHGLASVNPLVPIEDRMSNAEAIAVEAGDLLAVIEIACDLGVIDKRKVSAARLAKWRKVGEWLHHIEIKAGHAEPRS